MRFRSAIIPSVLIFLSLAAAAEESDQAYAKRMTAEAVPGCASAGSAQLNLSAEAATSMCNCAFRRLFSENPIKDLRAAAKAQDFAYSRKLMRPLMQACYEAETTKVKRGG